MGKFDAVERLVNPEMESRLLVELEPFVEQAYDNHMASRPRNNAGDMDDVVIGTLDPLKVLYKSARLEYVDRITSELIEATRTSFDEHIDKFLDLGVDLRAPISLDGQMNLGTENNLEWYFGKQYQLYKGTPALVKLLSRWTAEEADHGPLIELWGAISGALSPAQAHAVKMALLNGGVDVFTGSFVAINAFTEPQEYDTYDAHTDFGKILDIVGRRSNIQVGGQEMRHGNMFGEIGDAIYNLDQEFVDYALPIEVETHRRFGMPGEGSYPGFKEDALQIAVHGLFTLEGVVKRQKERVERLDLLNIKVSTEEAKEAQKKLADIVDINSRLNSRRVKEIEKATERYIEREKASGRIPTILGRTLLFEANTLTVVPDAA